jgi:hypothetical protein
MWLEACVKIKWICTEESSQEGGAQGLMKYIKIKQTIETPTGRTLVMYIYLSTDPYITFENARDRASTERKVSQVGNKHGHAELCTAVLLIKEENNFTMKAQTPIPDTINIIGVNC